MNTVSEGFADFLKKWKGARLLLPLLLIGIVLLVAGAFSDKSSEEPLSSEEERLGALCSGVEGVGECRVMISYEETGRNSSDKVVGVAVVCEGGGSVAVQNRICMLITSLYGIGANRICILPLD